MKGLWGFLNIGWTKFKVHLFFSSGPKTLDSTDQFFIKLCCSLRTTHSFESAVFGQRFIQNMQGRGRKGLFKRINCENYQLINR